MIEPFFTVGPKIWRMTHDSSFHLLSYFGNPRLRRLNSCTTCPPATSALPMVRPLQSTFHFGFIMAASFGESQPNFAAPYSQRYLLGDCFLCRIFPNTGLQLCRVQLSRLHMLDQCLALLGGSFSTGCFRCSLLSIHPGTITPIPRYSLTFSGGGLNHPTMVVFSFSFG